MKILSITTLMTFCLFLAALASSAPDESVKVVAANHSEVLAGIPGVYVLIERLDEQVEAHGLKREDVQDAVDSKLASGGVKVISKSTRTSTTPILYVQLGTVADKKNAAYAYSVNLSLQENVLLQRNPKLKVIGATTWQQATVGKVSVRSVETLLVDVEELTDVFLRDFRKANLKR